MFNWYWEVLEGSRFIKGKVFSSMKVISFMRKKLFKIRVYIDFWLLRNGWLGV